MGLRFRKPLFTLTIGLTALSSATLFAVPKPADTASPFDKLDADKLTPIEKRMLPDIAVGVVTVDSGSVVSCSFSSDGKLATGTDRGDIFLWDLTGAAPKELANLQVDKLKTRVDRLAFAPDGKRLIAAVAGTLHVWDMTEKGG